MYAFKWIHTKIEISFCTIPTTGKMSCTLFTHTIELHTHRHEPSATAPIHWYTRRRTVGYGSRYFYLARTHTQTSTQHTLCSYTRHTSHSGLSSCCCRTVNYYIDCHCATVLRLLQSLPSTLKLEWYFGLRSHRLRGKKKSHTVSIYQNALSTKWPPKLTVFICCWHCVNVVGVILKINT